MEQRGLTPSQDAMSRPGPGPPEAGGLFRAQPPSTESNGGKCPRNGEAVQRVS